MLNCDKCGKEVAGDDVYEVNGQKLCESCAIGNRNMQSPSKPCGPNN